MDIRGSIREQILIWLAYYLTCGICFMCFCASASLKQMKKSFCECLSPDWIGVYWWRYSGSWRCNFYYESASFCSGVEECYTVVCFPCIAPLAFIAFQCRKNEEMFPLNPTEDMV